MLQIRHLTITHRRDLRTLLDKLDFVLNDGEKAVIIGEEGNGKSTLLKLIADPALVEDYVEYEGEIQRNGMKLGYLPQELPADARGRSVYAFMSESPAFGEANPRELKALAEEFSLDEEMFFDDRAMDTLSGGEKVKLQLARLMLESPDAFLLDEPSNDLDLDTLEWLEGFIAGCRQAVLFISHDETLIERTAGTVLHLELLRKKTLPRWTAARVPYREYVEKRLSALANQERISRKEHEEFARKMERFRQIRDKVEHSQNTITRADPHGGKMLKKKMHTVKAQEKRFEQEKENLTPLPDVEEAIFLAFPEGVTLPRSKTVLDLSLDRLAVEGRVLARNLSLRINGGEKVCITGKNGAGKTTLLREIYARLAGRSDLRAAYMPQNYAELLPMERTPAEFLAPGGSKEELTRARNYLGSVRYTPDEMNHPIAALSGGQKAKLYFLKMVLEGYAVLVLDEPTRNFSPLSGPVIRNILRKYGGTIISVSHDRKYMEEVCGRIVLLSEGGLSE